MNYFLQIYIKIIKNCAYYKKIIPSIFMKGMKTIINPQLFALHLQFLPFSLRGTQANLNLLD